MNKKDIPQAGELITLRNRDWVVQPSDNEDLLIIKPLGGSEAETTGIYLPLEIDLEKPKDAHFKPPSTEDLGDISTSRILYNAARLSFRNGAGPFRSLAKLSFRPRAYQIVPLVMALKQDPVRLLIADDVGVGKTIEALLIMREMLERRQIKRFAVICLPHLCEQWQEEIRTKLDIEAVIIRTNTQAQLDRQIHGDTSIYDNYPYQIISIDFIKSDKRRDVFVKQAPELVVVDEAHTCERPSGASRSKQQRHLLLSKIAEKEGQHLIMLTATPHSGKPEEFQSLLGLLHPEFENWDLPSATSNDRRKLAEHFVQRLRADVRKWIEDTPFPERFSFEQHYDLTPKYKAFFEDILTFTRKLVSTDSKGEGVKRAHYWVALALLRGVMSSPDAGVKMLQTRMANLLRGSADDEEKAISGPLEEELVESDIENPVGDDDFGFNQDSAPIHLVENNDWSKYQRRQLKQFAERLQTFSNPVDDDKLNQASIVIKKWLKEGFNPVVFCRYIATAKYLGEHLGKMLQESYPKMVLNVITSEDPDEIRKQNILAMENHSPKVLIATECLSEGINLQNLFTAVMHYDLPWNPNRLEQREGRVDRFGQTAPTVKTCFLYGADNPIDAVVLDVLLRKVREIKKATGINVPFPENSQSIIDTITKALLLNPDREIQKTRGSKDQQALFDTSRFPEAEKAAEEVLSIPVHPSLSQADLELVVSKINEFMA